MHCGIIVYDPPPIFFVLPHKWGSSGRLECVFCVPMGPVPSKQRFHHAQPLHKVFSLQEQGLSNVAVAKALKITAGGVRYILKNHTPDAVG